MPTYIFTWRNTVNDTYHTAHTTHVKSRDPNPNQKVIFYQFFFLCVVGSYTNIGAAKGKSVANCVFPVIMYIHKFLKYQIGKKKL